MRATLFLSNNLFIKEVKWLSVAFWVIAGEPGEEGHARTVQKKTANVISSDLSTSGFVPDL